MLTNIILALSEILFNVAYLFTDILILRLVVILGSIVAVLGGFLAGANSEGMISIILFNAIAVIANAYQSYKIIIARSPILLPNELQDIYNEMFHMMTPNEFLRIYQLSRLKSHSKEEVLCVEKSPINELIIIKSGYARVLKGNKLVSQLGSGLFIGEMSFLTGSNATATVVVVSDKLDSIEWDKAEINKLQSKDEELYDKLKLAIAINLIKKLDNVGKSAH